MTGTTGVALTSRTVWLDPSEEATPTLVRFAGDDGLLFAHGATTGLAARGVALRVTAAEAAGVLAAIEAEDEVGLPGCGPIAVGALPFVGTHEGTVTIPRVVLGRDGEGRSWRTTVVGGEPESPDPLSRPPAPGRERPPDQFSLRPLPPHDEWCDLIALAVQAVRGGEMEKVVLARQVMVEANRPIRASHVTHRLGSLYPSCMVFSVEGFVGASPELLISRRGRAVWSQPLAGTIPRSGDPEVDQRLSAGLLGSDKDRHEHGLVVDEVAARLRPFCEELSVPPTPAIVPLRNVSHLGTRISGRLGTEAPSALDLALRLHPTPAVAGTPTGAALAFLCRTEGMVRGRYTGPVGWVDARGDGDWAVSIRCAELDGHRARLYAGAGVVSDSTPDDELAETQLKLQALLAAIVRP